jgi:hypothetical protein
MAVNLIQELSTIRDFRTKQGQRHPLWLVLLLVIMGTMSGCVGYRGLGEFVVRHHDELIATLNVPKERLPSYSTMRRVMIRIDFTELTRVFNTWAAQFIESSQTDWFATDGKSIHATMRDYKSAYQDFVSVVSVFSTKRGLIVGLQAMSNKRTSEITTVQSLLNALDLQGVVFSLDALHCQKKLCSRSSHLEMIM